MWMSEARLCRASPMMALTSRTTGASSTSPTWPSSSRSSLASRPSTSARARRCRRPRRRTRRRSSGDDLAQAPPAALVLAPCPRAGCAAPPPAAPRGGPGRRPAPRRAGDARPAPRQPPSLCPSRRFSPLPDASRPGSIGSRGLALTGGALAPTLAAMKLGLAVPHYDISFPDRQPATFDRIARYAELGESLGFFQLWVSDHFWLDLERYGGPAGRQGTPECWTTLSALAVRTSRVRLGSLVLAAGFRPPALLAKMAATLDQISGGRLDLGLGAGWNQAEFAENGLPFPRPGERLAMLEETLEVLDRLLGAGGEPASFRGRFFTVDHAPVLPGPVQKPRPPLWVGGSGDRLLGVVA